MQILNSIDKPGYVNLIEKYNPFRNGLPFSTGSSDLENIVEENSATNTGNSLVNRAKMFGFSLLTAVIIACSSGIAPPVASESPIRSPTNTQQEVKNEVIIKYNKTDSNGIATFKDSTTGETVTVEVVDASSKPLQGMQVQYWDSTKFEAYMVEDPKKQYAPSLRIFSGNTIPLITTHISPTDLYIPLTMHNSDSGPKIREVEDPSEKQGIDNFVEHAENEWVKIGRFTPKQLNAEDMLYSFIIGSAGINTSGFRDFAGMIADISDSIPGWHEPDFYDVYKVIPKNPITTAIRILVPVQDMPEPTIGLEEEVDGQFKIAFQSKRDGNMNIYVMNADGSGLKRLTNNPAGDFKPVWSPDGRMIAFESDRDGNRNIYIMNADGSGLKNLTNSPDDDYSPIWSPNGEMIAFNSIKNGNQDVYIMNADGSGLKNLTNNPAGDANFEWSPDGRKIVLQSFRSGHDGIYIMNPNEGGRERLATNSVHDYYPDWSPDGRMIAFESYRDGDLYLSVINADGSGERRLADTSGQCCKGPVWSPDGRMIAFEYGKVRKGDLYVKDRDIYVINANGSGLKNLTNNPGDDSKPDWSPDGRMIAFQSNRDGNLDIYIVNADGSGERRLTNDPASDLNPAWSPILSK